MAASLRDEKTASVSRIRAKIKKMKKKKTVHIVVIIIYIYTDINRHVGGVRASPECSDTQYINVL